MEILDFLLKRAMPAQASHLISHTRPTLEFALDMSSEIPVTRSFVKLILEFAGLCVITVVSCFPFL